MAATNSYQTLILGARILDPSQGLDKIGDLAIDSSGRVAAIRDQEGEGEDHRRRWTARSVVDAQGLILSPGWIDMHVHVYEHATALGVNPDKYCLGRGTNTPQLAYTANC